MKTQAAATPAMPMPNLAMSPISLPRRATIRTASRLPSHTPTIVMIPSAKPIKVTGTSKPNIVQAARAAVRDRARSPGERQVVAIACEAEPAGRAIR